MVKNADGLHVPTEAEIEVLERFIEEDMGSGDYQPTPEQTAAYEARLAGA